MKRVKTIKANDGCSRAIIRIELQSTNLASYEIERTLEFVTTAAMTGLANAPYLAIYLSQIDAR